MKKSLAILLAVFPIFLYSQNIAITDNDSYSPNNSAMLDVMSTTKGMLVPRVTADQRITISNPATGLLVFDTDSVSFYFYSGAGWINLTSANASGIWSKSNEKVFLSDTTYKLGIGTNSPTGKFIVQADNSIGVEDPLFEVKDKDGQTVFAVHNDGIRVYVDETANGNIGGFAVSGRSVTKEIKDYAWISKDSVRFYLDDSGKGNIGGFAVSGKAVTKGGYDEFFRVTPDSTRIWVKEPAKGNIGGFAVSGREVTKGQEHTYLHVTPDSTRVYINDDPTKGNIGGFAVSGKAVTKGMETQFLRVTPDSTRVSVKDSTAGFGVSNIGGTSSQSFLDLTSENYFIGHESGQNNISGQYNAFIGYQAGKSNDVADDNVFIGYQTGLHNLDGGQNVFVGKEAGYNNIAGYSNCFIGQRAGYHNDSGFYNVFIGHQAGLDNEDGFHNAFIGYLCGNQNTEGWANTFYGGFAGHDNLTGDENVFIGVSSGVNNIDGNQNVYVGKGAGLNNNNGSNNVFIGFRAGYHEYGSEKLYIANSNDYYYDALVYGEFNTQKLRINNFLGIGRISASNELEVAGSASKTIAGLWAANSDKRIKTDIQDIENSFETILSLRPVKFKYTNEWRKRNPCIKDHYYYNFIAQEFIEVFPKSVKGSGEFLENDTEEILQIDAYNAYVVTIKAVQELINENKLLKENLSDTENRLKKLEEKIKSLK